MIKIAIAEDNSFALNAVMEILSNNSNIEIKHIARNGKELITKFQENSNIDIILMDIEMPIMGGIEATNYIKQKYPQVKVLILTMFDDDESIFNAIMSGASGYILKGSNAESIHRAIEDTMEGGAAMSPTIALKTLKLIRQPLSNSNQNQDFGLTSREIELLVQIKNGLTYQEIAENLFISYHTVRKHIENIYRKLQVNNKIEAIKKAYSNRIL